MAAKLDGHLPRTSIGDDDVNMSPNSGTTDPTADDVVPFHRRRQVRTGLEDHITVVTVTGEVTLVPMDTTQPTLGAVRVRAVQLTGTRPAGTEADPIIL
jgi:hypothetical protein